MNKIFCKNCGAMFETKSNSKRICSPTCSLEYHKKTFSCKIHGRSDFFTILDKRNGVAMSRCNICRRESRKKPKELFKKRKCAGCEKQCVFASGFKRYCSEECQTKRLVDIFSCNHDLDSSRKLIISRKSDRHLRIHCNLCVNEKSEIARKYKSDNSISCNFCKIEFCAYPRVGMCRRFCTQDCFLAHRNTKNRIRERVRVKNLSTVYMKNLIAKEFKIAYKNVPEELIDLRRVQIMLRRKIKEIKEQEIGW